jgi:hypothetical protein
MLEWGRVGGAPRKDLVLVNMIDWFQSSLVDGAMMIVGLL